MFKSDTDLHEDVLEELAFDPSIDERKIGIGVKDGVVTLSGTVPSYAQKLEAERIVKRISGVHGIVEQLKIDLPSMHRRNDADLATAAVDALRWNASVPKDAVFVKVENGWITLSGTVDWQYQREAARLAIASLVGVAGITNSLELRGRVSVGDIKTEIKKSFVRHSESDAEGIAVETHDGTVTLRGPVHSWMERDDATLAAYSVPGVTNVKNLLTVS